MLVRFLFIILFCTTSIGFGQTYEILEVDIVCESFDLKGLNTKGSDFSPYVSGDDFYFTSSREYDLFNLGENNWTKSGYLNIFSGKIKGDVGPDVKVKGIEVVSNKLMTDNHTGPLCISSSGDTMFFSQVQEVSKKNRKKNEKYKPQLYMSVKKGKDWGDPVLLPFNNEVFSISHPYYDSKSRRLYFASDLDGGKGGKDIFYVEVSNGNWTEPKNLEEINTEANEIFPCVIDGYVFFSSDRSGGLGGLDVYWKIIGDFEEEPRLLTGLNSPQDDFGMYLFPGMKKGFYSSSRSGHDDIYYLKMEKKTTVRKALAGKFT
jgi:hypothetical protein